MITGFLSRWAEERHYFPKAFDTAVSFLLASPPERLTPGIHAILDERIFASVQDVETAPMISRRFELHREYIDIQAPLTGWELHGYTSLPPSAPALEDRLDETDAAFYPIPTKEQGLQHVVLQPGQYAVYFPGELHCPCCALAAPETIRKLVLKIRRDCIR